MIYLGYDPGGNTRHGAAALDVEVDGPVKVETALLKSAEATIVWMQRHVESAVAIGIDTLTCWSTGVSGWRPADRWLRQRYPDVENSVASPNSLFGSMSLNGMATLLVLKGENPRLLITETHPKVMHWCMRRTRYDYLSAQVAMNEHLAEQLGCELTCTSEHEWDAAISALAAYRCHSGQWRRDLHALPADAGERLVSPVGSTKFAWPE